MAKFSTTAMDKTVFQVAALDQESDAREYWKQQTPQVMNLGCFH